MFTQKVSMDCTKEQYEKYLKAELEKMGYGASLARWGDDVIVNNYSSENGLVGNPSRISNKFDNSRTYLGKFNAPLFLALAAMTDKVEGGYKEKITDGQGNWASLSPFGYCTIINGDGADRYAKWRKATVSEIMAKFGEQPKKDIYITLTFEKEPIWESCEKLIDEYEAILLLKSKGYRIFKQTTTLEEV